MLCKIPAQPRVDVPGKTNLFCSNSLRCSFLSLPQELWGEVIMESFLTPQPCLHVGEHVPKKQAPNHFSVSFLAVHVWCFCWSHFYVLPQTGDMSCQSDKPWKLSTAQSLSLSATLWCCLWETSFSVVLQVMKLGPVLMLPKYGLLEREW